MSTAQLVENASFFKGSVHLLVPAGRGPRAQMVTLRHVKEPQWSPEQGTIRICVHPGESWVDLIPDDRLFPGTYNHFIGGANIVAAQLT